MAYKLVDMTAELTKMSKGKRTRISHRELAAHALDYVAAVAAQPPDVSFLEKLFALKDTRRVD